MHAVAFVHFAVGTVHPSFATVEHNNSRCLRMRMLYSAGPQPDPPDFVSVHMSNSAFKRARKAAASRLAQGEDLETDDGFVPDAITKRAITKRKSRKRTPKPKQNPDDPQPREPIGKKQRGGVQSAEELRDPPRRAGKNGGWLRSGGTNKGGQGATPAELRQRCRNALDRADIFNVPLEVIRDPDATNSEKMRAWESLARFGGLTAVSLTDSDGNPLELPPFVVQMMGNAPTAGDDARSDDAAR